jgi:hypothetical protein
MVCSEILQELELLRALFVIRPLPLAAHASFKVLPCTEDFSLNSIGKLVAVISELGDKT